MKVSAVVAASNMEDQLAYLIATVNRQLEEELQETLRPEGVPIEQFRIMNALVSSNGRSMRDLASIVLVDPSSLTKIVDRMVTESLVYRAVAPDDRRRILIFLTARGKALNNKLKGVLGKQQRNLVGRLDLSNAKQLDRILRQLKDRP
jgi:DNA-binding MarR family transcriptional regulator